MKNSTSLVRLFKNSFIRIYFSIIFLLLSSLSLFSQTTFFIEDFETDGTGTRYTADDQFIDNLDGSVEDFFGRIDHNGGTPRVVDLPCAGGASANIDITNPFGAPNGTYYIAGEDMNDVLDAGGCGSFNSGTPVRKVEFLDVNGHGIDITSVTSAITFKILVSVGTSDQCNTTAARWDQGEGMKIFWSKDGGAETTAQCFSPDISCGTPSTSNEPLHTDPNCDGDGNDGTAVPNAFTEYSFTIPAGGSVLDLRIEIDADASDEEIAFDYIRLEGTISAPDVCPTITNIVSSEDIVCVDEPFNLTADGLADMAIGDNGDANFGIEFKAFTTTPADPYVGGTSLGIVPFGDLTMGDTEAILNGATIGTAGSYEIYAILSPTPTDPTCRPSVMTTVTVNALPNVTFTALDDLCLGDGVQMNQVGGMPMQGSEPGDIGEYSGPGVTNNGTSYDFNPVAAGVGTHTIMYEYTDGNGCTNSATDMVEVFVAPDEPVVSDINVCEGESTLIAPTGGAQPGPGNAWMEDFEDHGNTENGGDNRYTSTHDFFRTLTDDDYFGRVEGATQEYYLTNTPSGFNIHSNVIYTGWNGDFYYAAEDLDDLGGGIGNPDGLDFKDVTFNNIDISGSTGLTFKGLFAAGENSACGSSTYDDEDFIEIYYEVDGGGEVLALCFNPDLECSGFPGDITNEPLYHDPNCDGDGGEGTLMTAAFAEFSAAIPDGGLLDLRIRVHMDLGSEEVAFDYFRVEAVNNIGTMYKFYDDDPNSGGVLLAGPATSYDPMTTSGTSPQSIWVTTCGAACESIPVEVVVTVSPNPTIGCPPANPPTIEGCGVDDITISSGLGIATMATTITEAQFIAEGGTISPPNSTTNITYIDDTSGSCPYMVTRTFTLETNCATDVVCVQNWVIDDTTDPTINCPPDPPTITGCEPADVTMESALPYSPGLALVTTMQLNDEGGSWTDNCNPQQMIQYQDDAIVPDCDDITVTRTFTITDVCGNTDTCMQVFTITRPAPTIMCPADVTVECGQSTDPVDPVFNDHPGGFSSGNSFATGVATGSDPCGGQVDIDFSDVSMPGCGGTETITRTWTVTNACGVTVSCDQIITVVDTTPPDIICPPDITLGIECGGDTSPNNTGTATGSDFCSEPVSIDFMDSSTSNCGGTETITRTWTATDACGNVSTCEQIIFTIDSTPPMINCPDNVTVDCNTPTDPANTGMATGTDSCSEPVNIEFDDITVSNCGNTETIFRTWTATDACGQTATCEQTITTEDTTPPTAVCNDITVELQGTVGNGFYILTQADFEAMGAGSFDGCGMVSITGPDTMVDCDDVGTPVAVTITVTDECGNMATCIANVIVTDPNALCCQLEVQCPPQSLGTISCNDPIPPAATNEAEFEAIGGDIADDPGPCGTLVITHMDSYNPPTDICNGRTMTRVYTIMDDNTTVSCTQTLTITPPNGPTIVCPADMTVECFADIVAGSPAVTTDCGLMATVTPVGPTLQSGQDGCDGAVYTIVYTVEDECGRTDVCTQTWTLANEGPTITCPADMTVECFADIVVSADNATVVTSCMLGSTTVVSAPDQLGPDDCPGTTYTYTYTTTDDCGRTAECQQVFTIQNSAPVVICPPDEVVQCEEDIVTDPNNLIVTTSCGMSFISYVKNPLISGVPNCDGTVYTYIYVVRDACGRETTCEQQFLIQNDAPTVTVIPGTTVECWEDIVVDESDATVVTDCPSHDYVLTILPVQFNGPENCPGTEVIYTYRVKDQCNRIVEVDRIFTIGQNDAPTILAPLDITCECLAGVNPNAEYAVVTTACNNGVDFTVDISDPVINGPFDCPGTTYAYTYTVTDACGRQASDVQTFTVQNGPPVFTNCPADDWLVLNCEDYGGEDGVIQVIEAWIASVTATTSCGVPLTVLNNFNANDIGTCINDGFSTVTFRATDNCGRQTLCEGTIIITDTEAPEIIVEAQDHYEICNYNTPDNFDDWIDEMGGAVAEDGCFDGDVSWTTSPGNPSINCMGQMGTTSVEVTFIATDNCGNKAETTATFHALMNGGDLTEPDQHDQMQEEKGEVILMQNRPNPFIQETTIGFYLPEDMEATLNVYDLSGRLIKQIQGSYSKGFHVASITRDDFNARGILFYQLETRLGIISKRMILTEK